MLGSCVDGRQARVGKGNPSSSRHGGIREMVDATVLGMTCSGRATRPCAGVRPARQTDFRRSSVWTDPYFFWTEFGLL
jgi:hypothetical protein